MSKPLPALTTQEDAHLLSARLLFEEEGLNRLGAAVALFLQTKPGEPVAVINERWNTVLEEVEEYEYQLHKWELRDRKIEEDKDYFSQSCKKTQTFANQTKDVVSNLEQELDSSRDVRALKVKYDKVAGHILEYPDIGTSETILVQQETELQQVQQQLERTREARMRQKHLLDLAYEGLGKLISNPEQTA